SVAGRCRRRRRRCAGRRPARTRCGRRARRAGAAACSGFRPARSRRRRRAPAPGRYGGGTREVLGAANRPSMPHRRAPASPEGWGRRAAAGPADLLPCCGFFRRRTPMRPIILALALALAAPLAAQEGGVAADVLTLDRIMSDP